MAAPNEETIFLRARNGKFDYFTEKEKTWHGSYTFIQAADTQYGLMANMDDPNVEEGSTWDKEIALTKEAIRIANTLKPKPRFFIVCGDLIDSFPGKKYRDAQIKDFKKSFKDLQSDIPLVCVCGNHDVGNTPTPQDIESYRETFGEDYFVFWVGGVKYIVLNSQYYADGSLVPEYKEKHEKWLDAELSKISSEKPKHLVIFQHIPWFLYSPSEDDQYFNTEKTVRLKMLEQFAEAGVSKIFCGHYHHNAGGWYESSSGKRLESVVTSAIGKQLGTDNGGPAFSQYYTSPRGESGFRLVHVNESGIQHRYHVISRHPAGTPLTESCCDDANT